MSSYNGLAEPLALPMSVNDGNHSPLGLSYRRVGIEKPTIMLK